MEEKNGGFLYLYSNYEVFCAKVRKGSRLRLTLISSSAPFGRAMGEREGLKGQIDLNPLWQKGL